MWAGLSALGVIDPAYLPTPSALFNELIVLLREGYQGHSLWVHLKASLFRTLSGFLIGVLLGVPLGLVSGYSNAVGAALSPIMSFIRPIPPIAFIPLSVLYFGLGETGKIVLITFTAFNYTFINAHAGAKQVPSTYYRASASLGLTKRQVLLKVVSIAAIPQIFTGMKIAMALSWAVVVAAELVGAQTGLGFMISDAAQLFRIPTVFIGVALIGLIGLLLNAALTGMENKLVHWKGH
ncbi:MAG: ABC transporter permease [Burkholderiaceae bacterium]|nr:ABC transporter permease [Burkholderiaceae bacterium]